MKALSILVLGLVLPLSGIAQWSKGRAGELKYHCAACMDVPDLSISPSTLSMKGVEWGDITLYDSLGRTVAEWTGITFNDDSDAAAMGDLYYFVSRRIGYVEFLLYRPLDWSPHQYQSFTYIIPTIRREKEEKLLNK